MHYTYLYLLCARNRHNEMTAKIIIDNLQLYAHIGCYEEERRVGTQLSFSASLLVDISKPSTSDNVCDALNYVEVCDAVKEVLTAEAHLLETVAARIAERLKNNFADKGLIGGTIRITKCNPPIGQALDGVAIEINL